MLFVQNAFRCKQYRVPKYTLSDWLYQILQCVAMNLTLIYALLAYSSIKQRDFTRGVYVSYIIVCVCIHNMPMAFLLLSLFVHVDGTAGAGICACLATPVLINHLHHCLVCMSTVKPLMLASIIVSVF